MLIDRSFSEIAPPRKRGSRIANPPEQRTREYGSRCVFSAANMHFAVQLVPAVDRSCVPFKDEPESYVLALHARIQ